MSTPTTNDETTAASRPALDGKRALITGAAQGIGSAIAEAMAGRGALVMISDIDAGAAEAAAARLGGDALAVCADVSAPEQVRDAVDATTAAFGGLDILVNNAGMEIAKPLTDHGDDEFARVLDVNVNGVFYGMKYAAPALSQDGGGAIVNIASVAGLGGAALFAAYCASKAAVLQLTRVGALEYRELGVRVNAVCPGLIQTAMLDAVRAPLQAAAGLPFDEVVRIKQGRFGRPEEIAEAVCFLASGRASFTTGAHYVLDGGLTAGTL
jgi:NAD(P)-dependent dehydrogenase (short-subunit alcohol dehydrogenase family)